MGGAHAAEFFPTNQGLICVQRERRAEDCLKMLVMIYKMHARMVGINQIWNTCMKHLNQNANKDVFF